MKYRTEPSRVGCPGCKDLAVYESTNILEEPAWFAEGWPDDDGYEQEIDFCPFCGERLKPSI